MKLPRLRKKAKNQPAYTYTNYIKRSVWEDEKMWNISEKSSDNIHYNIVNLSKENNHLVIN